MTVESFSPDRLAAAAPFEIADLLEAGRIVHFPTCPIQLPGDNDQTFLRETLPRRLKLKNISYHPEADRVRGLEGNGDIGERVHQILTDHSRKVSQFLDSVIPSLTRGWTMGTCSFRPLEEKGRNLKPHASTELVHFDAGAYGATTGDRLLRFFVNHNPAVDRVWATKGTFPLVFEKYGDAAGVRERNPGPDYLKKTAADQMRTGFLRLLAAAGLPMAKVLDSSPYDRTMRKFHNFMKDTPAFQDDPENHEVMRFGPFSAWMVFTDMVSHAALSGQFCFVTTGLVPLRNCRRPELAPVNILKAA